MKKLGASFLVLLALAHLAGVMPFSLYFMQEVKTEAKISLANSSELTRVVVHSSECNDSRIFQLRDEDEFMYRGQMYDFKSMSREGGNYIFYGQADDKETSLIGFLSSVFEQPNDRCNNKTPFGSLFKTLEKDFIGLTSQSPLITLTAKYTRIEPFTSNLLDCHSNAIFHPPA